MQGIIDVASSSVQEDIIKEFAYYLQTTYVSLNPNCIIFWEDLLLDDENLFQKYEAYTKAVIETADANYFEHVSYIFFKSVFDVIEDYDVEAMRADEHYGGLENLICADINPKTRVICTNVLPNFN